jgi:SAM-dependent methyltransferase
MYYSANYETSLYASAVFRDYADALVQRLISTYDLRGKNILEIGCGRGEFLRQLCRAGNNRGTGFDTSTPFFGKDPEMPKVSYVRDYFSKEYEDVRTDLIVCQQVLEHIENPKDFLSSLVETQTFQVGDPLIYLEVPNGLYTAKELGIWDLIYEHVSYFTPSSLRRLVEESGFEILVMDSTFGDQYLYVEARVSMHGKAVSNTRASKGDVEQAKAFAESFRKKLIEFRNWVIDPDVAIGKTYIWGAGSKGITFCNLVDPEATIAGLIDRNTKKHGKYTAETGLEIFGLEDIDPAVISNIVIMNPQYTDEIRHDLDRSGISAKFILP